MKNKEKYKTFDEAIKALELHCAQHPLCFGCPYGNGINTYHCEIKWLYSEAEENKKESSNEE